MTGFVKYQDGYSGAAELKNCEHCSQKMVAWLKYCPRCNRINNYCGAVSVHSRRERWGRIKIEQPDRISEIEYLEEKFFREKQELKQTSTGIF